MKLNIIPIKKLNNWKKLGGDKALLSFCEHIISHSERYIPERVFEAKEIVNNLKSKINKQNDNSPTLSSADMVTN